MRRPHLLPATFAGCALALAIGSARGVSTTGDRATEPVGSSPPSRFGKLTSKRWAYGADYVRESLAPIPNPNPAPEPQPRRDHPFDVAVSGDGTKVYISLQGSELQPGSEVAVYDLGRDKVVRRIPLGLDGEPASSPYRLTMHPGGRFLLVTNRFSNFASIIDTASDKVTAEIPLDFYAQGAVFSADGSVAYVVNRYLDQVFILDMHSDDGALTGTLRQLGGLDDQAFFGSAAEPGIHARLKKRCGTGGCHDTTRGGFVAGADPIESFLSVLENVTPGDAAESRLLREVTGTIDGGWADVLPKYRSHAGGQVIFRSPNDDSDFGAIANWINAGAGGPGVPVGNPRSKPKVCALSSDGRYLFVGNTGTQDISIVDTERLREVGAIYVQNLVNDVKVYHSPETGHDYLLATSQGIGFGVGRERDPYGGETWESDNPAAHYSVWRDPDTGRVLPKDEQEILGPFDAVDGTAAIKFRDIQNDLLFIDIDALEIPEDHDPNNLSYLLAANRYESHRGWTRYTSDTAESTYGDIKGDIPPDLMRVVGAMPERMTLIGDHLFVTMQGSNLVQQLRINPTAPDPSDVLMPMRTFETGLMPTGIASGPAGTPAEGLVFVANFLGGSISIIDTNFGTSREVLVDPSIERRPVPATNAERGELLAHTSLFSSDGDTSCFHCHYLDMGDGRPWGVSQVVGQEYLSDGDDVGQLVIGGTMTVPQMRNLFTTQPFFVEGVISAFEPRSMLMEHAPADDFAMPTPQGDFTQIEANWVATGTGDVQSAMDTATKSPASLQERRDEMFRQQSMHLLGKAFTLRDFQRFVGEWQISEPRLLPNPFDPAHRSVLRGKAIFEDPQVGCSACHQAPDFTRKNFENNPQQALEPMVLVTPRDGAFTLVSMNRLDAINGTLRDLEPWDRGRSEEKQAHYTTFPLRGIWDRPPVFLHSGIARSLREVISMPGHFSLRKLKYEPRLGGEPERPNRREVGFNMTMLFTKPQPETKLHRKAGARLGFDTHGGTSHLTPQQIDDLVNFMNAIN